MLKSSQQSVRICNNVCRNILTFSSHSSRRAAAAAVITRNLHHPTALSRGARLFRISLATCRVSSRSNAMRLFRTKIKHSETSQQNLQKKSRIELLAKILKLVRIPVLIISVYGLGYNQGIMDYARSPEKKKLALLEQIVKGYGCEDPGSILIAQEGSFRTNPSEDAYGDNSSRNVQLAKVSYVGSKIVQSAKSFVNEKLQESLSTKNVQPNQNRNLSPDQVEEMIDIMQDPEVLKWTEAKERMDNNGETWKFVLVESPVPNACVSELVPCTIFVTTALLSTFTTNDDELALILGHEVSHLIHGHGSEAIDTETFLKTMEVLMLSLDPTEGFLSIFIIGAISLFHRFLSASYSQHHELEADAMGMALAARACFDTKKAPLTFKKMHDHHLENTRKLYGSADTNRRGISDFLSTHPPSIERYENLTQVSVEENPDKYANTHCAKVKRRFVDSLLWTQQHPQNES